MTKFKGLAIYLNLYFFIPKVFTYNALNKINIYLFRLGHNTTNSNSNLYLKLNGVK